MSERIVAGSTRDRIRSIAADWHKQYPNGNNGRFANTQAQLDALDVETATAAEVEAIIGNKSWTAQWCDVCGSNVEKWVRLGDEPDYESATVWICGPCLAAAQEAIRV